MAIGDFWLFSKSNNIIAYSIVIFLVIAIVYLTILSIIVKDIKYPRAHPWLFTIETLLFSVGAAAIIFLMAYGRNDLSLVTIVEFLVVALKFGLLHILLQFSGFYSYGFNYKID